MQGVDDSSQQTDPGMRLSLLIWISIVLESWWSLIIRKDYLSSGLFFSFTILYIGMFMYTAYLP